MAGAGVALQQFQLPLTSSSSSSSIFFRNKSQSQKKKQKKEHFHALISKHNSVGCISNSNSKLYLCNNNSRLVVFSGKEETELQLTQEEEEDEEEEEEEEEVEEEATPEDMEYIAQIKRVLELLKKNRDMLFSEVKLTVMIEDPREVERRRLLGIEDADAPTREDLAEALEQYPRYKSAKLGADGGIHRNLGVILTDRRRVDDGAQVNEGKVPKDRVALRMLAEEMAQWPNLEV
ncbi:hypothetical protein Pint_11726 [Pistacia integerrima]|uniref:Uncharacterized protein n=1 Tax=Pistacia integerrima TaxID=434235 RepID=A0ACC0XDV8_9ROSI|nr:hypothetical protein Pint_11726 [Pistacia integerrima]